MASYFYFSIIFSKNLLSIYEKRHLITKSLEKANESYVLTVILCYSKDSKNVINRGRF